MAESTHRNYYSYRSAMAALKISRRTLQRWIDAMCIDPMEFEGHITVMLSGRNVEQMFEYKKVLASHDSGMIDMYRNAVLNKNDDVLNRIRRQLKRKKN